MIRVNLLPHKREAPATGDQRWLLVLAGALLIEAVALFFVHQSKLSERNDQRRKNQDLNAQIQGIRTTVANHEQVKAQLASWRQREEAIAKLQRARTGPTGMLLELSRVMTPSRGPTVDTDKLAELRRENPQAVPNLGWDAHRLWVTSFKEEERTVTVEGLAKDGDDVSELARRLALSSYFGDVRLLPAVKSVDAESKLELVKFQMQAKVRY